jgi:glycosyltransferase involved in cell wall biosynthesis
MKIFLNTSYRSDEIAKLSTKKIDSWFIKNKYTLTYNCFENGVNAPSLNDSKTEFESNSLYSTALKSLQQSDIVVLEISTNSFTQGYILQKSLEMGKPVIALHQRGKYSVFVKGIKNNLLQVVEYDDYNLIQLLENALDFAIENLMSKFNFYLSSDISNYLTWISKNKKLPKSEFVRLLIRDKMSKDQEYLATIS